LKNGVSLHKSMIFYDGAFFSLSNLPGTVHSSHGVSIIL